MGIELVLYGGVNEIGGNKILLEVDKKKIFLDFGISFTKKNTYYSEPFLRPNSYKELLELGILPDVEGIYEDDQATLDISGVFLSHAHLDHCGDIVFLKKDYITYCGETTSIILKAQDTIKHTQKINTQERIFSTFRTRDRINIDDNKIIVEPIHVDHSIPGAYGFIIYTNYGNLVYTGDFRLHGNKKELSYDFIEKAKEANPLVFITEGTNMQEAQIVSETELQDKLDYIIKKTSGLIITQFSYTDIDRLNSFYHVSKNNNRLLVVTTKLAFVLHMLQQDAHLDIPPLDDKNILIFKKKKKTYYNWESELFDSFPSNIIDTEALKDMQDRVVLVMPFYDFQELINISPIPGSLFILSSSEPFTEEMELDYKKLLEWLKYYGLPLYMLHVSGHIMPLDLLEIIASIRPKIILPIHTQCPQIFYNFFSNLNLTTQIILPQECKKITL